MDAQVKRDTNKYALRNKETGAIEDTNLGRIAAKDLQNILWARGIKTELIVCRDY